MVIIVKVKFLILAIFLTSISKNLMAEKVFETQIKKSEFYECHEPWHHHNNFGADMCEDINHKYSSECKGSGKGKRCDLNKIYFESFLNLKCQEKSYNEFTNYFFRTPKLNNGLITLTYGCKGSNIKKVANSHKPEKEIEITSRNYKKFLKCQDLKMNEMVNDYEKMVNNYKESRKNKPENMPDFGNKYYLNLAEYKKNPFKICPLDKEFVESYLIKICKKNNFSSYDSYYFKASNIANVNPKIIYQCSSDLKMKQVIKKAKPDEEYVSKDSDVFELTISKFNDPNFHNYSKCPKNHIKNLKSNLDLHIRACREKGKKKSKCDGWQDGVDEFKKNTIKYPDRVCGETDSLYLKTHLINQCKKKGYTNLKSYTLDMRAKDGNSFGVTDYIYSCKDKLKTTAPTKSISSLDYAKRECLELGFKNNTEKFGECVLQLSK